MVRCKRHNTGTAAATEPDGAGEGRIGGTSIRLYWRRARSVHFQNVQPGRDYGTSSRFWRSQGGRLCCSQPRRRSEGWRHRADGGPEITIIMRRLVRQAAFCYAGRSAAMAQIPRARRYGRPPLSHAWSVPTKLDESRAGEFAEFPADLRPDARRATLSVAGRRHRTCAGKQSRYRTGALPAENCEHRSCAGPRWRTAAWVEPAGERDSPPGSAARTARF